MSGDLEPPPSASGLNAAPLDTPSEAAPNSELSTALEEVTFKIQFGKDSTDIKRPFDFTVGDLKSEIEKQLGIPSKHQKLMCKGSALKDNTISLRQVGASFVRGSGE